MSEPDPSAPQAAEPQHRPEGGHPSGADIEEVLREDDVAELPPAREGVDKSSPVIPRTGETHQH